MTVSSDNESELIAAMRNGSQETFAVLFEYYAPQLIAFAMKYCHNRELAEEITEDTFVWIWTHRETLRNEQSIKSIIFIKTHHLIINAYRSTLNSPQFCDYINYVNSFSSIPNQGVVLEYQEFLKVIRHEMEKLTNTQRSVIELSRFEMMSIRDIAAQLGMQEQTIRNQLSLGLKHLRKLLKEAGYSLSLVLLFVNLWR